MMTAELFLGAPGRDPQLAYPPVLTDLYTGKRTRPLGLADTGHGWFEYGSNASSYLTIVNGKLTNVSVEAATRAGYISAGLGARVHHIGGSFTLSPTSNPGGGVAAFQIWTKSFGSLANGAVVDTGFHLIVSDISWALSYWSGQVQTTYPGGGATFAVPLATDGTTILTLSASISGNTALIIFPDGSTAQITDAHLSSLAGNYAGFEVYQSNASTDTKAAFTQVWATT
jgi:hypothetical protein